MNNYPQYQKELVHIQNATLKTIMNSINIGIFNIQNAQKIRIFNPQQPDAVIILVEADIGDDIVDFLNTESLQLDKQLEQKDIIFEQTIFDYVLVKIAVNSETNKPTLYTVSLLDLIITENVIATGENEWSIEKPLYTCIEIISQHSIQAGIKTEDIDIDFANTDIRTFG